jgi:dTDP-4-amino-4,6-dideoxygalactose transaminase
MGYKIENYPISYDNYSREISLPIYYNLTNEQVKKVCDNLKQSINEVLG